MSNSAPARKVEAEGQKQAGNMASATATPDAPCAPVPTVFLLQRAIGNRALNRIIQAKLTVSTPGDRYEQEADRMADHVMRMPQAGAGTEPKFTRQQNLGLQRACQECEEELQRKPLEQTVIQRKESAANPASVSESLGTQINASRGFGQSLPTSARAFFEPRFGYDFGQVRVHTSENARSLAQAVNARAFTVGRDIFFGANEYAPDTHTGQRLMAHELTHVIQQSTGSSARRTPARKDESQSNMPTLLRAPAPASAGLSVQRDALSLLNFIPGGMIDTKYLIGKGWLLLPKTFKAKIIDYVIAFHLKALDVYPGKFLFGDLWEFMEAGLKGFLEKLKTSDVDLKINAVDKLAAMMAGDDPEFSLAYMKGLLKGFFVDGMLGIFIAIYDLLMAMKGVWDFFKDIGDTIGGFPDEMKAQLARFQTTAIGLLSGKSGALDELKKFIRDPKQIGALASTIAKEVKGFIKQAGANLADSLLKFFSKPGASAEIGEAVGNITGMVLWEVAFAIVTEGGGVAVTLMKQATGTLTKILAKVAQSILKVVGKLVEFFKWVINGIRSAAKFVKGKLTEFSKGFGKLFDEIVEFLGKLLSNCHESKLTCKWPKHHPFPKYLGGLHNQTLKKLPPNLHHKFHSALDKWKGGKYARVHGAKAFVDVEAGTIIKDLREFYKKAEGGIFAKYLPDFEQAVKETMKGVK